MPADGAWRAGPGHAVRPRPRNKEELDNPHSPLHLPPSHARSFYVLMVGGSSAHTHPHPKFRFGPGELKSKKEEKDAENTRHCPRGCCTFPHGEHNPHVFFSFSVFLFSCQRYQRVRRPNDQTKEKENTDVRSTQLA